MQDPAHRDEKKFRDTTSFTYIQMEAALCAWEWMLENTKHEIFGSMFEDLGYSAMRMVAVQAGDIAARVHDHMEEQGYEYTSAYDWKFVPDVLLRLDWKALTEDNQYSGAPYQPDIHAIFVAMVAADKAHQTNPQLRDFQSKTLTPEQYIAACRQEAERMWGYGDLVSDHPERVTEGMERDETPAQVMHELGVKYDLTPRSAYLG